MSAARRGRFVTAALLAPLLAALAACGGSSEGEEEGEDEGPVPTSCPSNMTESASTQAPDDVPLPEGASSAYDYVTQGATKYWYYAIDGSVDDLVSLRDAYDETLEGEGYEIEDTDAEPGHEAESEFRGKHEGTTNFQGLCAGKVVFRLKLLS